MERKIDWVAVNPVMTRRSAAQWLNETVGSFRRDVGSQGIQAQHNHAKLSEYHRQMDALRRGEV